MRVAFDKLPWNEQCRMRCADAKETGADLAGDAAPETVTVGKLASGRAHPIQVFHHGVRVRPALPEGIVNTCGSACHATC